MGEAPQVVALAIRTTKNGPMRELVAGTVERDGGLQGDLPVTPSRGLTLLGDADWSAALDELGCQLPWFTRRANVLVRGLALGELIGRRLRLGEVELQVLGETEPCRLMDRQYPGLLAALRPHCRAGVHGRVLQGGRLAVGDAIEVLD